MALFRRKKEEFRPDTPSVRFTNRFYLSPQQRRKWLKWLLFSALCLVMLLLQDVIFSRVSINGATIDLVPCAVLLVCVLQGAEAGAVFGLTTGLVYYLSGSAPGVFVILLLPFLGAVAAAFRQGYLRKGFRATMLCAGVAVALYELSVFGIGLLLGVTLLSRFWIALTATVLAVVALPVIFPMVYGIAKIGGDTWKE